MKQQRMSSYRVSILNQTESDPARQSLYNDNGNGLRLTLDEFKVKAVSKLYETLEIVQAIWNEAGYEEVEIHSLLGDFYEKVTNTCNEEIQSEQEILEHAKQQVNNKLKEYMDYCKQLGRVPIVSVEGYGSGLGNTYADKLAELDRLNSTISVEVSQRLKVINNEFLLIDEIVTNMGENPPAISSFDGPEGTPELSDLRLHLLRQYRQGLEEKKDKRINEMKVIAKECYAAMKDLVVHDEDLTSLRSIKNMDQSNMYLECDAAIVAYSKSNYTVLNMGIHINDLDSLKDRLVSLKEERELRRSELATTGSEIARLWTLLRIPTQEREVFQSSFEMNLSVETIEKGRMEVARLQDIRTKCLAKVIASIRTDISSLWDEVGIECDEQRQEECPIFFMNIEELDDSSVDVHEQYYTTLKSRVEELRPLLNKISRREAVVLERIELEHIQLNPERLKARGPNAREDRKREEAMTNRVKNLEKNTKDLLAQISNWEETNGTPFIFAGEKYSDRVQAQEAAYIEIRDSLRNARKKKEGKDQVMTSTLPLPPRNNINNKKNALSSSTSSLSNLKSVALTEQALLDQENYSNNVDSRVSRGSDGSVGTEYTSVTEVRPRSNSQPIRK